MLELALREEDIESISRLARTATQRDLDSGLIRSVLFHNDEVMEILLEAGANPNSQDDDGRTPFYLTLLCRRPSLSQILIRYGCNVDLCKANKSNALHYAAKLGDMMLIKLIVAAGCNLNMTNWGGNTAVLIACRFGHRDVVQYLLESGAQIDICNRLGHYPLHYAAYYDDIELINILIAYGARGDCHTYLGVTPLMLACQRQKCAAVNKLAPLSNLEFREKLYGGTALFWAIHSSCRHCMKALVEHGADTESTDNSGRTILIQAIQSNSVTILNDLLHDYYREHTVSLLIKPSNCYALHFACYLGYTKCVETILCSPHAMAFLNQPDWFGDPPLGIALRCRHFTLASMLVGRYGAQIAEGDEASVLVDESGHFQWQHVDREGGPPPFKHEFFKTYSSVKMGMIDLLQSSEQVQIVAPVTSSGFDFDTWLDRGPDAFNLKVTSLELTDWLKNHMQSPLSLRECSRGYLRRQLGYRASDKIEKLNIPKPLRDHLNMRELRDLKKEDITIGNIKSHPWVDIE